MIDDRLGRALVANLTAAEETARAIRDAAFVSKKHLEEQVNRRARS